MAYTRIIEPGNERTGSARGEHHRVIGDRLAEADGVSIAASISRTLRPATGSTSRSVVTPS